MRKLTLLFFTTVSFLSIQAQNHKEYIQKADSCYQVKDFKTSAEYYGKAFKTENSNPIHLYNGACSAALTNKEKLAFNWLNLAIQNGYDNLNHLKKDSDLESLHSEKEWGKLTTKLQEKLDIIEVHYDKPLQQELISIYNEDQAIRKEFMAVYKEFGSGNRKVDSIGRIMNYKDSLNLIKVIQILDTKGWVSKDFVGSQGNLTLFLVIQHSNLKTQQKYLPIMREAVKKGNANSSSLALLEDRVALGEGKKQIYGSQIGRNPNTQKEYILPLEDPGNVDKRREEVGLGLLADYVKKWNIVWNIEAYKKELVELEKLSKK
jgi:hypothetical protein